MYFVLLGVFIFIHTVCCKGPAGGAGPPGADLFSDAVEAEYFSTALF